MAKTTNQTELTALIKQEKDVNVQNRLVAVRAVRDLGMPQARVAEIFDRDRTTISRWTEWYDHDGPDGLRDLPRSGRPTKADPDILDHTMKEVAEMDKVLPERVREIIHEKTGTWYNPDYVREHAQVRHVLQDPIRGACQPRLPRRSIWLAREDAIHDN